MSHAYDTFETLSQQNAVLRETVSLNSGIQLAAWYNKKSINLQHDAAPDERMFSQELAQDIIEGFRTLMPLYKYFDGLCAAEMV